MPIFKVVASQGIIGANALYEELKRGSPKPEKAKLKHKILTSEAQELVKTTNRLAFDTNKLAKNTKELVKNTNRLAKNTKELVKSTN